MGKAARLVFLLLAFALMSSPVSGQDDERRIVSAIERFRLVAFGDSIRITSRTEVPPGRRFLLIDSVRVADDSGQAYLTFRNQEHVHREVYTMKARGGLWNVIAMTMDRILRLHEMRR